MASEAVATGSSTEGLTPAQKLMEQHDHHVTVEDVVDEEDIAHPPPSTGSKTDSSDAPAAPLSEKAAGKQKAQDTPAPAKKTNAPLNMSSEEAFPALGPAKPRAPASFATSWGKKPASVNANGVNGSGQTPSNPTSRASTPASGMATPASVPGGRGPAQQKISLPGKETERIQFYPSQLIPRKDLKKPLNDIIRDINKRSKAKLECKVGGPDGVVVFEATGPRDAARQSLKEIANEVGSKQSIKVPVPSSVRPFIIGRQGAKIQEISKRSGARVQVPKQEPGEDEDSMIDVTIDGNALTAEMARREIESIVNERTSTVNLRLKDIPAEYYPFLAGPHNAHVGAFENGREVNLRIPHYHTWDSQAPPQVPRNQPVPFVPQAKFPIQISGERSAAQDIQAQIERRVQQLREQLAIEQRSIERGRHQFIIGERGGSLHDFLAETGCSVILPPSNDDSEAIYIVGPPDRIEAGVNKLEELASEMSMATADAAREHKGANSQVHAHNLTRYLQQRQALSELERLHEASIVAPTDRDGPTAWEIYSRDRKNNVKARGDIINVFASHPPSRFSTVSVDPFYHHFLQQQNARQIREDTGVHVVFPNESEESPDLILVYEGATPFDEYTIPRGAPPAAEIKAYQQALQQAQQLIQAITIKHPNVVSKHVEAHPRFHPKIERFADKQQQGLPQDQIPVQLLFDERRPQAVRSSGNHFGLRGPSDAVEALYNSILEFIEQEEKDELERGYTTSFDFPQKFANYLIGKRGENIKKLREEFDVDIQVNDGKVELKGPQAKANACKAHILALGKRLEDEATHTLKIKPQYHRDLIGAKGSQVNRLQDRYNVRINFPRSNHNDDEAAEGGASQRNFRPQAADEVTIRGPRKGADEARDELLNLLQWTTDNSHTDIVSVAQSQVPQLIGTGGREMENLRLSTGCQIDVPGAREVDPSGRAEIRLKGTKKQVEEAKKILMERAKAFDNTVVENIEVDRKHHRTLIGGSGSNIRQIVTAAGGPDHPRELARMVRFPRPESEDSNIRVEGPKNVVEKILASIRAQVESLDNQVTEVLDISPDKHRLLIGRGGETRRSLESQFNVQLDIPKQTTTGVARNQVKITGEPDLVEKAKEHILDLVKGQEGETIHVPRHLHHAIADNGQFFRRLKNDHKVSVDHAGEKLPPKPTATEGGKARKGANGALPLITDDDAGAGAESHSWEIVDNNPIEEGADTSATIPWVLRGHADNIPKARQALESAIEAASKPSATGYLILPDPRSYRLVVGPGGSTINNIRRKTGTKVQVPRDQKDEAIEIVGPKDGCEEARQMILDIIAKGGNGGHGGRK
ncbi:RNA binding effector protein-like protein Scp160 [Lentithecium fluviatile CBS 122367]|uniref:RNA binding effector protein-like protein Scp160 n=1 Tax=Lentithecium fluviatile CBS 122367 TaxID=1168545 RepID=A0A6G1ISE5_9PLEO|nr:RNA binding effector protein-like protein Scp160 [Lentithecium fluviatile CBS 122367]